METWTLTWTKLVPIEMASELSNGIQGVYRLSYKHEDGKYYVFYVGQAQDIKEKLLEHQKDAETNVGIKARVGSKNCFFRYATITEGYVRNSIERQLYKYYQPSANEREPEGREDVKGNID